MRPYCKVTQSFDKLLFNSIKGIVHPKITYSPSSCSKPV